MGDFNQDPSMEEILASIKRVIAEDGKPPAGPSRAPRAARAPEPGPPPAEPASDEDVLELNDPVSEENGLMSTDAAAVSRQALAALKAIRQGEEAGISHPSDAPLEAVVKDMLRPMLKAWLDQHLPDIVEELVTREIARITGKDL